MRRLLAVLEKRPNVSFIVVLILLFGVIFLASLSRSPEKVTDEVAKASKTSRVFPVSESGFVTATAQVKKSGVIDIVAQTGGTVQSINVRVGQNIGAGTTLVTLTNDYGVNAARIGAEKARLEGEFTDRVFSLEKEINERARKIADDNDELTDREEKNTIRNLRVELERLRLNRETARLNTAIANASDAVLRPKSLSAGTVEFIGVRVGENIAPGKLIATIRGTKNTSVLLASIPDDIARFINPNGIATLVLGEERLPLSQGYLSQSENTLGLRSLTFPLWGETANQLTESEFVSIVLPLTNGEERFFVPIDSILSGANGESVLVLDANQQVIEKGVTLGDTIGSFVMVRSGLTDTDRILLNRGIAPGEIVEVVQ